MNLHKTNISSYKNFILYEILLILEIIITMINKVIDNLAIKYFERIIDVTNAKTDIKNNSTNLDLLPNHNEICSL